MNQSEILTVPKAEAIIPSGVVDSPSACGALYFFMESKRCKYCNSIFYKKDFPKCFNRMITCGKKECKQLHNRTLKMSNICPDCNKSIAYFAKKCHSCSSKGEGNPFYGKTHKPESLVNVPLFLKGHVPYLKGKHHKAESNQKNSIAHIGEKSANWRGGISFIPYTIEWTKILRNKIRKRDNYTCQICGTRQTRQLHSIHHIDYNKKNNKPWNLLTLCKKCHGMTNFNREFWSYILRISDSGNNNLPEPSKEKLLALIDELKKFTTIDEKRNLARLLK